MLFWIFVIATVVLFVLAGILLYNEWEITGQLGLFVAVFSFAITLVMLLVIILNHVGLDPYVAEMHVEREALVWQYENDVYDNDNDLGKRELITDIQKWNENLAYHKAAQNDFWIGIFHADIYDQFEPISFER